ncbi:MAG: alpha/beta hydrolase [Klenkia sp.]|nr:alpha/beta hydrolase [Klenkia sp.]
MPTYDQVGVPAAREQLEAVVRLQQRRELGDVTDHEVAGPAGPVPVRVYRPDDVTSGAVVVYLHGGGFVLGSIAAADRPCRGLAVAAGCVVVSVGYRLAPEAPFPGGLEDCVAAVRWAAGLDGDRLVLLGDSAGGALVAGVSAVLRDAGDRLPDAQVLLYPTLAPPGETGSMREFADGPMMTRRELEWFWGLYAPDADPAAAPLLTADLAGLPATTVVVAELDPLRDEGLAYADRLAAAGVVVQVRVVEGAPHGFWWLDRPLAQADELTAALVPVLRGEGPLG